MYFYTTSPDTVVLTLDPTQGPPPTQASPVSFPESLPTARG